MFALITLLFKLAVIVAVLFGIRVLYFWRREMNRPMTLADIEQIRGFPLSDAEMDELAKYHESPTEARAEVKRLLAKKRPCVVHQRCTCH